MQILINQDKTYIARGTIYPVKVFDGEWVQCTDTEKQSYMVVEENCVYPQSCTIVDVLSIPTNVTPQKYIYENGEFKPNPNWVAPPPTIDELQSKITSMQEVLNFLIVDSI